MVTGKSCNISEQRVDLPREKGSEPVEPVLKNIYQSNTYRKDHILMMSWPHFDDEP